MEYKINEKEKQVQVFDGNKKIGLINLVNKGDLIEANHTEVDKEYSGKGIAGILVDKLVEYARLENKKIIPTCSYIRNKFEKDEKYKDVYFK
ncbi:MAG: GNAT family N-acetyltransferase [Anaerococcus vaginalis]|nr:GNAT family N-acetyltransferase [Anaerococcus vaginalis]